jgi:pimeloyl-ACP methyl ester carboxylesterase
MPFLELLYATLYYDISMPDITQETSRRTLLLLHGFLGTPASDFADQLPSLREEYTILAPHLHGQGRSSHRSSYTIAYYREDVEDIVALLDTLHIAHVLVLGFSDGAIVGLLLAALHPDRVTGMAIHGAQPTITTRDTTAIRSWLLEKPLPPQWQEQLTVMQFFRFVQ